MEAYDFWVGYHLREKHSFNNDRKAKTYGKGLVSKLNTVKVCRNRDNSLIAHWVNGKKIK
jgi:hypothetical protein